MTAFKACVTRYTAITPRGCWADGEYVHFPTHWMPLPDPLA